MKKLITIIFLFTISVNCFSQDTLKVYTKIINYGKPNEENYKCYIIRNIGQDIDTICIKKLGSGQACRDSNMIQDTLKIALKNKIEADYKNDLKQLQELQTKILKEESYLEILNYLIEERKK